MALFRESAMRNIAHLAESSIYKSADKILQANMRQVPLTQDFQIFLCHSFNDAELILGVKTNLEQMGYSVYVDHQVDPQLDRQDVTLETANYLRIRMQHSKALFYITSFNSSNSKWMPWELGYFDGFKSRSAIFPLAPDVYTTRDTYNGQEYLGIYPYITHGPAQGDPKDRLWVHLSSDQYVIFESWLSGVEPTKR